MCTTWTQADLAQALADIATLQGTTSTPVVAVPSNTTSRGGNAINIGDNAGNISTDGLLITNNSSTIGANTGALNTNTANISSVQNNSVMALDGLLTFDGVDAALFTGVNVQIVSGSGTTGAAPNGTGNLIVGYDEIDTDPPICSVGNFTVEADCTNFGGTWASSHKTGSHNVVIGDRHNYTQHGSLLAGQNNNVTGAYSSVTGGTGNTAAGSHASASGGFSNQATGIYTSVSGGQKNSADGDWSSVSGGLSRSAIDQQDWAAGALYQDN